MTTSILMRLWPVQHANLNLLSLKEPIITKVCFKTFVTWIIKLYNFPNTSSASVTQIALESLQGMTTSIETGSIKTLKGYLVSRDWKSLFSQEFYDSQIPDIRPWNILFWKTKYVSPTSFCVEATINWMHLFVNSLFTEWMNLNEFIYHWTWCFWRTSESSLLKDTFQKFFLLYSRIVSNWSSKYEILSLVGHLRESSFLSPLHGTDEILEDSLRIDEISEILKLLSIFKLSFSKPFWNISNYASIVLFGTIWIMLLLQIFENLWSFYNLGDKSFETGFRKHMLFTKQYELLQKIPIHGGGCKVFTVLCSIGKLADSPLSVYLRLWWSMVFNPDHLENSLITSQNVMDLIYWNSILPGKTLNFTSTLLHGYKMKQPNVLRKLVHSAGRKQ